jgi:leukotriene-A4 hydrolase
LLYFLEKLLGGDEIFEPYLRAHVQEFAGRSINTNDWKDFLYSFMAKNFGDEKGQELVKLLDTVDWDAWLSGVGMVSWVNLLSRCSPTR